MDDELTALAEAGETLSGERGKEVRDALREALSGSNRVRDIVRDLRTFSRGNDEQQSGPVDVRAVLDSCVNMAWSEIRHRARLVKDYGDVPPVNANESRLAQIFITVQSAPSQGTTFRVFLPVGTDPEQRGPERAVS